LHNIIINVIVTILLDHSLIGGNLTLALSATRKVYKVYEQNG